MSDLVLENANLKNGETLFFKFRNLQPYNIDAVLNNYLYFTEPSTFRNVNDPTDFLIKLDFYSTKKHIRRFINYMNKILKGSGNVFPYQTIAEFRKNMTEENLNKQAREAGDKTPQEDLIELLDQYRVFCLSDYWKSDFFWNSDCFCKNYEGFCIGYKGIDLLNQGSYWMECNQLYEPDTMIVENNKFYFSMPKVIYDKDDTHVFDYWDKTYDNNGNYVPHSPNSKNTQNITYNFLHKYEKFSDEHEYRAFFFSKNNTHRVEIPKENIKCIIFGMNCSNYLSLKTQMEANNPNLDFYLQILDSDGHVDCQKI